MWRHSLHHLDPFIPISPHHNLVQSPLATLKKSMNSSMISAFIRLSPLYWLDIYYRKDNSKTYSLSNLTVLCGLNSHGVFDKLGLATDKGFPGGSNGKESVYNARDTGSNPGLGRSPGEGNRYPLQYSCLENPMNRGAWWATVTPIGIASSKMILWQCSRCLLTGLNTASADCFSFVDRWNSCPTREIILIPT